MLPNILPKLGELKNERLLQNLVEKPECNFSAKAKGSVVL
jgi:hypothetical protein